MLTDNCSLQTANSPGNENNKTNLFAQHISTWKTNTSWSKWDTVYHALLKRWLCPGTIALPKCCGELVLWLVAVCGTPFITVYHHLPGARMSGLPFFATVFCRFMARLCLPGMEKAWFSFPPCGSGMICAGGMASRWTWRNKVKFLWIYLLHKYCNTFFLKWYSTNFRHEVRFAC